MDKPDQPGQSTGADGWLLQLRPYTMRELCDLYGIKYKAMRKLLDPLEDIVGKPAGRYYTVRQLELIVEELGPPFVELYIKKKKQ